MIQAGGHAVDIRGDEIGLGKRESVKDVALVMSRYVDAIMIRTFAHKNVQMLARYSGVPVINGLSDYEHPCQALSDVFTIREKFGTLAGVGVAFVGDGNNVARSLAVLCTKLGMNFTLSAPAGHEFEPAFFETAMKKLSAEPKIRMEPDPAKAVENAQVVYTDVWASMGQESEAEERKKVFRPYQVNAELMSHAAKDAVVMHCLPAHRGDEISDDVIDSPKSIVYDQAENRLHVQKGLLFYLLGAKAS
jgi:ornithine carbamoyltransferase